MKTNSRNSSEALSARNGFADSNASKKPRAKRRLSALYGKVDQHELINTGRRLPWNAAQSQEQQFLPSTSYRSPRSTPKCSPRQTHVSPIKRRSKRKPETEGKDNHALSPNVKTRRRISSSPITNSLRNHNHAPRDYIAEAYQRTPSTSTYTHWPNTTLSASPTPQEHIPHPPPLSSPPLSPLLSSPSTILPPSTPQTNHSSAKPTNVLEHHLRAQSLTTHHLRTTIQSVQTRLFALETELERLHGLELSVARLEVLERDVAALKRRRD